MWGACIGMGSDISGSIKHAVFVKVVKCAMCVTSMTCITDKIILVCLEMKVTLSSECLYEMASSCSLIITLTTASYYYLVGKAMCRVS